MPRTVQKAQRNRAFTVLLPVDGSAAAERAVRHVAALTAQGLSFEVLLINVQPHWAPPRSGEDEREGERLHREASERVFRPAKALLERAGIPAKSVLRVGSAEEQILKEARQSHADAIVMGTRGRGPLKGLLLGSVAMKVLQLAKIPVTLVR